MNFVNYLFITLLSLITTIVFISIILYSDRKSREPLYMILIALTSGLFTICLSLLLGQVILPRLEIISSGLFSYSSGGVVKVLILALVEEYCKMLVLYLFISKNSNFDDIYDGFVYSSLVALSFAALETLIYVFNQINLYSMTSLAILRGLTTVPLHLICGIVMGYYMGREKFSWGYKFRMISLCKCLIVPTIIHFIYNFSLTKIIPTFTNDISFIFGMILFFIPFYVVAFLYIKKTKYLNDKFIRNEEYKNLMKKEEYIKLVNNNL